MMKRIFFMWLFALTLVIAGAGQGFCSPKAVPLNPRFEFSPIPEGQGITHEFIVKNEGDTTLNITGVIPP